MDGAVFTYTNFEEFEVNLIEILNQGPRFYNWQRKLEDFLTRNSAASVANQYINLFQFLLKKKLEEKEAVQPMPQTDLSLVVSVQSKMGLT